MASPRLACEPMPRRRSGPVIVAAAGDLIVQRDGGRPSGRLLRHGDMDASYVDLADPRHLEFDYLRRMRDVVEVLRARRVVHVGGAACALARAPAAGDRERGPGGGEIDAGGLAVARGDPRPPGAPGGRGRPRGRRGLPAAPPGGAAAA